MALTFEVYRMVRKLPSHETYALSDQMRRSVVSIPSNIAEGAARESRRDFKRFLYIARGSACELETQCLICIGVGYIDREVISPILDRINEIKRMLAGLITRLNSYSM